MTNARFKILDDERLITEIAMTAYMPITKARGSIMRLVKILETEEEIVITRYGKLYSRVVRPQTNDQVKPAARPEFSQTAGG